MSQFEGLRGVSDGRAASLAESGCCVLKGADTASAAENGCAHQCCAGNGGHEDRHAAQDADCPKEGFDEQAPSISGDAGKGGCCSGQQSRCSDKSESKPSPEGKCCGTGGRAKCASRARLQLVDFSGTQGLPGVKEDAEEAAASGVHYESEEYKRCQRGRTDHARERVDHNHALEQHGHSHEHSCHGHSHEHNHHGHTHEHSHLEHKHGKGCGHLAVLHRVPGQVHVGFLEDHGKVECFAVR